MIVGIIVWTEEVRLMKKAWYLSQIAKVLNQREGITPDYTTLRNMRTGGPEPLPPPRGFHAARVSHPNFSINQVPGRKPASGQKKHPKTSQETERCGGFGNDRDGATAAIVENCRRNRFEFGIGVVVGREVYPVQTDRSKSHILVEGDPRRRIRSHQTSTENHVIGAELQARQIAPVPDDVSRPIRRRANGQIYGMKQTRVGQG